MDFLIFYVGQDRESGMIVEDQTVLSQQWMGKFRDRTWARKEAEKCCESHKLDFIHFDGPIWVPLGTNIINHKPYWESLPPLSTGQKVYNFQQNLDPEKWLQRFRSNHDLQRYKNPGHATNAEIYEAEYQAKLDAKKARVDAGWAELQARKAAREADNKS